MSHFYFKIIFILFSFGLIINPSEAQNFHWAKSMGGTLGDAGNSVAVDALGNVYTTGTFQGTVDFDPSSTGTFNMTSNGSFDVFVYKLDKSGNFVWAKQWGGLVDDRGYAIALDGLGNIYTTGYFKGTSDMDPGSAVMNFTSQGVDDMYISKLDPQGNLVWAKQIGGSDVERGKSIAVDGTGNIYTTGYFAGTTDFDPGAATVTMSSSASTFDIFVSKLTPAGDYAWAKRFGVSDLDEGHDITVDGLGNVYITGEYGGTVDFDPGTPVSNLVCAGVYDAFILKLDGSGAFVWAKSLGGDSYDVGASIAVDATFNVYTSGFFEDVCDFDPGSGTYNLTAAGGVIDNDIFISKLNPSGNFLWAKRMGAANDDASTSIALDAAGNVYTTGNFHDVVDFDPSATGTFNLTSNAAADIFISKLDNAGVFVWAKQIGGTFNDNAYSIYVDAGDNIYLTGEFYGPNVDFDPGAGTANLSAVGDLDFFALKLGKFNAGINHNNSTPGFTLSPNPANKNVVIDIDESLINSNIFITDILGKEVYSLSAIDSKQTQIDLSFLSNGVYFVRMENGEERRVVKLVKE